VRAANRTLHNPRLTPSGLAPIEDRLAMLLKGMQASLQSTKHRDGTTGLLSGPSQLLDNPFLPSNTLLEERKVSLGLGNVVLLVRVAHAKQNSRWRTLQFDLSQTGVPTS
jgi:hypothetical protein